MKTIIPVAVLALALAPAAHAQVACSQVDRVIEFSKDDFDEIAGKETGDDVYEANYTLSGATECAVDYTFDSVYACFWAYDSYAAASAAYTTQRAAVAACLPGWSPEAMTPSATATDGYRTLEGVFYGKADLEWGVFLKEHTFDGGTDWHVTVGMAWLL